MKTLTTLLLEETLDGNVMAMSFTYKALNKAITSEMDAESFADLSAILMEAEKRKSGESPKDEGVRVKFIDADGYVWVKGEEVHGVAVKVGSGEWRMTKVGSMSKTYEKMDSYTSVFNQKPEWE